MVYIQKPIKNIDDGYLYQLKDLESFEVTEPDIEKNNSQESI